MSSDYAQRLQEAQAAYAVFGPLADYDPDRNGPLLGVSDGGYFSQLIVDAAVRSAKMTAARDARSNGLILDAERMGSAGETPVGPDEYAAVGRAASGVAYFTTNVGVRANARNLQLRPELSASELLSGKASAFDGLAAVFAPFLNAPGGTPRPLNVLLRLSRGEKLDGLADLGLRIAALRPAKLADPELHRVSVLAELAGPTQDEDVAWLDEVIVRAAAAGFRSVAIDGPAVEAARVRCSVPGLLNVLPPIVARHLLRSAAQRGVLLETRLRVDTETLARTVWAGLQAARSMGLNAAKYGLTPLTFDEQREVIRQVQGWTAGWTAIPAFYADGPLVTRDDILLSDRVVEAATLWLEMAARAGARVVLFDCPDRYTPRIDSSGQNAGRRLLRRGPDDVGAAFGFDDVMDVLGRARDLGVRILWSGGILPEQAYELARRRVAGIFTTSSTARPGPVTPLLVSDPRLAAESAPTPSGVRRVHAVIQAGFLSTALATASVDLAERIVGLVPPVLAAALESTDLNGALEALDAALADGWARHWQS